MFSLKFQIIIHCAVKRFLFKFYLQSSTLQAFSVLVIRIACRSRGWFVLYAPGETGARVVASKRK